VAVVGRLYKNRKETAVYRRINSTQNNAKTRNIQNRKQTYKTKNKHKRNTEQYKSSDYKITGRSK